MAYFISARPLISFSAYGLPLFPTIGDYINKYLQFVSNLAQP
jgi:hypothetical protein